MVWDWLKRFDLDNPGCTMWPEGSWHHCCVAHDYTYADGGPLWVKIKADWELGLCVAETGHPVMGGAMFLGTLIFGFPFWMELREAQEWGRRRVEYKFPGA